MWPHEYVHMAIVPGADAAPVDRAMRIAKAERTVTCMIIPNDVQEHGGGRSTRRTCTARFTPASATRRRASSRSEEDLQRAADVLNAGRRWPC